MTTPLSNVSQQDVTPSASPSLPQADPPAWKSAGSLIFLLSVTGVGLTSDLISKHLAFASLPDRPYPLIQGVFSFDRSMNFGALFGIGRFMTEVFILASIAAVLFVSYMFITSRRRQWVVHLALGLVLAGAMGNLYDRLFVKVDVVMRDGQMLGSGLLVPNQEEDSYRLGRYPDMAGPIHYYAKFRSQGSQVHAEVVQRTAVRDFIRVDVGWKWTRPDGTKAEWSLWPWIFNVADSMLVVGVSLLLIIYWRHPVAPAPRDS